MESNGSVCLFWISFLQFFISYFMLKSAHERIHSRLPRFVCPECGICMETWNMFKHHVQRTCLHESRVLAIQCVLCTRKMLKNTDATTASAPPVTKPVWVDYSNVLAHFYQSHIQVTASCSVASLF